MSQKKKSEICKFKDKKCKHEELKIVMQTISLDRKNGNAEKKKAEDTYKLSRSGSFVTQKSKAVREML